MKILIIVIYNVYQGNFKGGLINLKKYIDTYLNGHQVDIACICSDGDFTIIDDILKIKYKIINSNFQMDKMCDFISEHDLDYDWFIKTRPEVEILEEIHLDKLEKNAINARARVCVEKVSIPYGSSIGGRGIWNGFDVHNMCDVPFNLVLDDQIYIFDRNTVLSNAFTKIDENDTSDYCNLLYSHFRQNPQNEWLRIFLWNKDNTKLNHHEWFHTFIWNKRNIRLNIIGINIRLNRNGMVAFSGDIN